MTLHEILVKYAKAALNPRMVYTAIINVIAEVVFKRLWRRPMASFTRL